MTITIISVSVIVSTLVEIFRYRSKKKEDPKTTLGSVLSNGIEQLLIIFLSAIVALFIANASEEKKMKDQIIKVLDVVQDELEEELASYNKAVNGNYCVDPDNNKLLAETVIMRFIEECEEPQGINLRNFLYSESVLIRIDPKSASEIARSEDQLLAFQNDLLQQKKNTEQYPGTIRDDISEIVYQTTDIIKKIEYAKMQLKRITNVETNKQYKDFADSLTKKYYDFLDVFNQFAEDDLAAALTDYDDSLIH